MKFDLIFTRYIYQHRDSTGRMLGINISKSILEEHTELDSQYLTGIDIYLVLLMVKEDIATFCELFKEEFEKRYGLPSVAYCSGQPFWGQQSYHGQIKLLKTSLNDTLLASLWLAFLQSHKNTF